MITLTIHGHEPAPWAVATVGRGRSIKPTPERQRMQAWQQVVRIQANQSGQFIEGGVVVQAGFYLTIPKSWPAWKRDLALQDRIGHTQRPDAGNLMKALEDGLHGAIFGDDSYVTAHSVSKSWVADVSQAGVVVTVAPSIARIPSQIKTRAELTDAAE